MISYLFPVTNLINKTFSDLSSDLNSRIIAIKRIIELKAHGRFYLDIAVTGGPRIPPARYYLVYNGDVSAGVSPARIDLMYSET